MHPRPTLSTLFPYTTLFRSSRANFSRAGQRDLRMPVRTGPLRIPMRSGPIRSWGTSATNLAGMLVADVPQERIGPRSEEHTSELQSLRHLVCRLLLEKKKKI